MDLRLFKLYKIPILLALSCVAFYFSFAYGLNRADFFKLISLYAALCFLSFKLVQILKTDLRLLTGLAIIFRLVFILALPNLSQDYFRFIWDGRLIAAGWNPYQYIPDELIGLENFKIPQARELIAGMGSLSAGNFSNYPPLNQLIFAVAGWISSSSILGSVIVFRLFIILADIGTLIFGRKLLNSMGLPEHRIFWYILNPFIIIEMTGNLHFEAVMVFLLVLSVYLLHKGKWFWSAVILGMSVSVKLLPLMFLPLLFRYFIKASTSFSRTNQSNENINSIKTSYPERSRRMDGFWRLLLYYVVCISTVLISFLPFYSEEVVSNFLSSVGLWFGKFEFNASIYYIVRWFGFQVKGYNIIETAGKVLPIITILIILGLSFFRRYRNTKQLITNMLLAVTAYLLLSTTVHPWYLAIPLLLSLFTGIRYVLVWTVVVMLSYYAYSNPEYNESMWLLAMEYVIVFFFLVKDLFKQAKPSPAY
ncbi:GPI-GlcNAc transferase complex PIG-U subunit [Christiangramia gaetbulicola]|uniref:GPI-GlcNAc transferase complex PIG-U subunit n=1 Tax=Christiangramia gaetbulicola TaxID=703340 RepID=A0A2T6ALH9_9FLAO|nr:glycosyltransferase 87 family protein [Christiangramia gaetbulicola]PTX44684.1 GPI-GlcNAc transferase complex PIG-U subunit [Christiangramia gaetbulicola]